MGWANVQKEKAEQSLLPVHGRQGLSQNQEPRKRAITTPSILQNFLGFLCLVYLHGQHRRPCRCLKMCNCMTKTSLTMTFQFPHWLLSYALTILYTFSNRMGPELLLRIPKVRPANSELFHFACTGNLDGMRSLFRHGLASPFDIEYGTGLTALHVSSTTPWREYADRGILESGRLASIRHNRSTQSRRCRPISGRLPRMVSLARPNHAESSNVSIGHH